MVCEVPLRYCRLFSFFSRVAGDSPIGHDPAGGCGRGKGIINPLAGVGMGVEGLRLG